MANTTTVAPKTTSTTTETSIGQAAIYGALGGIVGGMVFGMMMSMLGMIETIAMLVGSEALIVGWAAHMAISVFIGATFGVIARAQLTSWGTGIGIGVAYGMFWWVLGALVLMPARLGMPVFQFNTMAWQSLMGHMVFGLVMGAGAVALARQSSRN